MWLWPNGLLPKHLSTVLARLTLSGFPCPSYVWITSCA